MIGQAIDFQDSIDMQGVSFAQALQDGAEQAAWVYDEACSDPQHAGPALDRLYIIMQQLRRLSLSHGYMRVGGICEKVCLLIDVAPSDLLHSLRDEIRALRRVVIVSRQDDTGAMAYRA
jgi:hypothetical protein